MTKKIQKCLKIKDNDKSLNCILGELQQQKGESCPARFVFLHSEYCPPCKEEEKRHAASIEAGLIQKISIESSEGMIIAKENNIYWTPALLILDCNNKVIDV